MLEQGPRPHDAGGDPAAGHREQGAPVVEGVRLAAEGQGQQACDDEPHGERFRERGPGLTEGECGTEGHAL